MIELVILTAVLLPLAFGLAFWAYRARRDRSALVGLYLLFGIPAVLLLVAGGASLVTTDDRSTASLLLVLAAGLGLPLLPPVRRLVAAFSPLDPASPVDMAGLCLALLVVGGLTVVGSGTLGTVEEVPAVNLFELIWQAVLLVAIAYIAVGWRIVRSFGEATARLGITRPSWGAVGAAIGAVGVAFVAVVVISALSLRFQPEVGAELEQVMDDLTANVRNPLGAAVLGITAGVGEEAVFRGAMQPRFGILLTSVVFSLVHSAQYGVNFSILGIFVLSLLLGVLRIRYGTTAAMITHALYNFAVVMIQSYAM